jgi:hypothetical protein
MKYAVQLACILSLVFVLGSGSALLALQRSRFGGGYQSEYGYPESDEKAEWTFARLRYATRSGGYFGGFGGFRGGGWSEDYPKADRQFVEGLVRLTRLNARSTQEVVDPDTDTIYNWPWVYAVNVGTWDFSEAQAKRLREYLLKGGFLVVDNFHGAADWESFLIGMRKVLPDRAVEELDTKDEIFHVLYDLDERVQVPGYQYIATGRTYERDGIDPKWRGIRDDQGRLMVAICFNQHIGDSWEHADDPRYPERFSSFGYRSGINYIIYALTH